MNATPWRGHLNHSQAGVDGMRLFEAGTWGGEFHPDFGPQQGDVVVHEHWGQSDFANTDLDMQLTQRRITPHHPGQVAHSINGSTFAHAILTTDELIAALGADHCARIPGAGAEQFQVLAQRAKAECRCRSCSTRPLH